LRRRRSVLPLDGESETGEVEGLPAPSILADWSIAPESLFDSVEVQAQLKAAIAALPESLRVAFLLRDVEGLSTAETAQILDISPGAVKVRLHRARLQLREHLSEYFSERLQAA